MSACGPHDEALQLIRDSVKGIAPPGDLRRVRALRYTEMGFDRDTWRAIGTLGWPGARVPEAAGGAGLSMREYAALTEALGEGLAPEPVIAAALAACVLRDEVLAAVLSGERIVIPAWQEAATAIGVGVATEIGVRVNGRKCFVPMGAAADAFLVAGRGGLALVEAGAAGVRVERQPTQDGGHVATVTFSDASGQPVGGDPALATFAAAIEEATLATAAMLLGVMQRALALTLDYLRTREQFGRKIGSFQALQHRAADLAIEVALTRASVEAAAATLDTPTHGPGTPEGQAGVSRAKARAATAGMLVTRQAIQLHGGIGYTDEADVGLFLRRAMVLANSFGGAAPHRARFAVLAAEEEA